MPRYVQGVVALCMFLLASSCSSGPGPTPAPAPDLRQPAGREADPTTADGIFTLTQAERGQALYREVCSECHDTEDWTETGFKNRWADESVFQLWYYINDRMPYENPWSLTRQQVTDVLTFILQLNDLPPGDAELATDDDSIDDYWIAWTPPQ